MTKKGKVVLGAGSQKQLALQTKSKPKPTDDSELSDELCGESLKATEDDQDLTAPKSPMELMEGTHISKGWRGHKSGWNS